MQNKNADDAKLPCRSTRYSAGFDVYSNEDVVIEAGETKLIGLGIIIDLDSAWKKMFTNKSKFSLYHYIELHLDDELTQKGLIAPPKIVNLDNTNELKMSIHNPICGYEDVEHYEYGTIAMPYGASMFKGELNQAYKIYKGDKIGQLILKRHEGYLIPQEYTLDAERSGGFGSTGQ